MIKVNRHVFRSNLSVFALFVIIFSLLFLVGIKGFGGYWDWSFPYFSEHLPAIFSNQSSSWLIRQNGTPLSYSPDILFRLALSMLALTKIPTEIFLYLFMVSTFSLIAYFVWKITFSVSSNVFISIGLALVSTINPLMLYKLLAGHFNYFPSLLIFVILIYFLRCSDLKSWRSVLTLGLLVGVIGLQIQFFFFALLLLGLWCGFYRKNISINKLLLVPIIVLAINIAWLTNFLSGANNAGEVSNRAREISRVASSSSSFSTQFEMTFSSTTHIDKIYPAYALPIFSILWIFSFIPMAISSSRVKKKNEDEREKLFYTIYLLITLTLATGFYMSLGPPISFISPMFREIGHFGPIAVIFMSILVSYNFRTNVSLSIYRPLLIIGSILFVACNAFMYIKWIPTVDYSHVRDSFSEFEKINKEPYDHRVLSYPFFGQYSFLSEQSKEKDGFLLSNVGYDNYLKYAGFNSIENALQSIDVKDSPQFQLLKDYDLSVLQPYNVKYLFDFSEIYESNYDRYVSSSTYDNDLKLVKNNKDFFKNLIDKNPGKLKKISNHVYEITDYTPIISEHNVVALSSNGNEGNVVQFLNDSYKNKTSYIRPINTENYDSVQPLFAQVDSLVPMKWESKNEVTDRSNMKSGLKQLYIDSSLRTLSYKYDGENIVVYSSTQKDLKIDKKTYALKQIRSEELIYKISGDTDEYILRIGESSDVHQLILDGSEHPLAPYVNGERLKIYTANGVNLVRNGGFSEGAWQPEVSNCSERDNSPDIGMGTKDDLDNRYLYLESKRHTACTYQDVPFEGSQSYLLDADFKSSNAKFAQYSIVENGRVRESKKIPLHSGEWESSSQILENVPFGNARLYLYSEEPDSLASIGNEVDYDNLSIKKLDLLLESDPLVQHTGYENVGEFLVNNNSEVSFDSYSVPNLLPSENFTRGLWKGTVDDCGNYDDDPVQRMELKLNGGYAGSNALLLGSTRHTACTSTDVSVSPGKYTFSFNYTSNIRSTAAYAFKFDDSEETYYSVDLPSTGGDWNNYTGSIMVPQGAAIAEIFIYTREGDKERENLSLFSDLSLRRSLNLEGRHMLVEAFNDYSNSERIELLDQSPSSRRIKISNITFPMNIIFGEGFNRNWRIKGTGLEPVEANGRSNMWKIDTEICHNSGVLCSYNDDGSINSVILTLYFSPQRYFSIGFITSLTVTISIIAYITKPRFLSFYKKVRTV